MIRCCLYVQVVKLTPPAEMSGEGYILSSPDGSNVKHNAIPEGGVHHGCFEYCFQCTESSGYSDRWCHSGDMDDLTGCLSGQPKSQTLFSRQKVTTASQPTKLERSLLYAIIAGKVS